MSMQSDFNRAFGNNRSFSDAAEEVSSATRDAYEQTRDSAAEAVGDAARATGNGASSIEQAVRNTVENQPYTAVAIALGLGWLLGRLHRPL